MPSYVGLDVSLAETSVCVLDGSGRIRFEGKDKSRVDDLVARIRNYAASSGSGWRPARPPRALPRREGGGRAGLLPGDATRPQGSVGRRQ